MVTLTLRCVHCQSEVLVCNGWAPNGDFPLEGTEPFSLARAFTGNSFLEKDGSTAKMERLNTIERLPWLVEWLRNEQTSFTCALFASLAVLCEVKRL